MIRLATDISDMTLEELWELFPIILVELPTSLPMDSIKEILISNGYICMSEQPNRLTK